MIMVILDVFKIYGFIFFEYMVWCINVFVIVCLMLSEYERMMLIY